MNAKEYAEKTGIVHLFPVCAFPPDVYMLEDSDMSSEEILEVFDPDVLRTGCGDEPESGVSIQET